MSLLPAQSLLCGLMLHGFLIASHPSAQQQIVSNHNELRSFRDNGIFSYSTMLIREDLGVLLLGARGAIFALDLNNISAEKSVVYWRYPKEEQDQCMIERNDEVKCRNYVRTLHTLNETTMYVCGTNVMTSTCAYMTFVDGQLLLKGEHENRLYARLDDPFERYSTLMVGRHLYAATSTYITIDIVPVHSSESWNFVFVHTFSTGLTVPVHMEFVGESFESQAGDDDKIYLFFSESGVEYGGNVVVSRVARMCKVDMSGFQELQRQLTSFLKARLDCSLSEAFLPPIVQDVFLLKNDDWRKSVFYAVFTPPSSLSQTSFVCAYIVSAIRDIFNEGNFKTPDAKSVVPASEVPIPRPGACINNVARNTGIHSSLGLSGTSLKFIRKHPLMDEAVQPIAGEPLLVVKGPLLTRIVVDCIMALDGQNYSVMFVGTENGYVKKAVDYGGEMFIIEEIQLYKEPVPISTMRLSENKGQIYAGSEFGAVQMPVSNCSRHATCVDCILARDPYCAWDLATKQCSSVTGVSNTALQSLKEGDSTLCPQPDPVMPVNLVLVPGNNIQLLCQAHSNLAQMNWRRSGQILRPDDKYHFADWGLLIVGASTSDAGLYICDSVEQTAGRIYNRTVAAYQLQLSPVDITTIHHSPPAITTHKNTTKKTGSIANRDFDNHLAKHQSFKVTILVVSVILLSLACISLTGMVVWSWKRGRLRCFKVAQRTYQSQGERHSDEYKDIQEKSSENSCHTLQSMKPLNAINNHSAVHSKEKGGQSSTPNTSALHKSGCIQESEI